MIVGQITNKKARPANTDPVALVSGDDNRPVSVMSLDISAGSSGASATVRIDDGTNETNILDAVPIPANDTVSKEWRFGLHLGKSEDLEVIDSVGNELHFVAVIIYRTDG